MIFRYATLLALVVTAAATAAPPSGPTPATAIRFRWAAGQVHTYRLSQQTVVKETLADEATGRPTTTETRTGLTLTRRWTVTDVAADGTATLEMTITALRQEIRRPDGSRVVLDSAVPEQAKEMAAYLNVPVLVVRVDSQGRLVEVKQAKAGGVGRLQAELPFRLTLPDRGPEVGATWQRACTVTLDPPHGTGEQYELIQTYTAQAVKDGVLVVSVRTALKAPPPTVNEQMPLVPLLWAGEVDFHTDSGTYAAARLKAKAELVNHLGEGSKFEYESVLQEERVGK